MQPYTDLESMLKGLRLKAFVSNYQSLSESAEKEGFSHLVFLKQLSQLEIEARNHRKIDALIRRAKLPRSKTLKDFESIRITGLSPSLIERLAEGDFMDRCENVLIFGNPGTGKTHLAIGLSREWCLRGRKVFYTTAARLVQELLVAKKELAINKYVKKLDHYEVLVIDDISYVPYGREETDVLFVLLAERYEQRSVVVTSNLAFSQWHQIFKDEMTTAAAIDRLVHHSTILELNASSYRTQQAQLKNGLNIKKTEAGKVA